MPTISSWRFSPVAHTSAIVDGWAKQAKFNLVKSTSSSRVYQGNGSLKSAFVSIKLGTDGIANLQVWIEVPFITQLATLFLGPTHIGIDPGFILQLKRKKMSDTISPLLQNLNLSLKPWPKISGKWNLLLGGVLVLFAGVGYLAIYIVLLSNFRFSKPESIYFAPGIFKLYSAVVFGFCVCIILGLHYWAVKKGASGLQALLVGVMGLASFLLVLFAFFLEAIFMGQFNKVSYYCLEVPSKQACDSAIDSLARMPVTKKTKRNIYELVSRAPQTEYKSILLQTIEKLPLKR